MTQTVIGEVGVVRATSGTDTLADAVNALSAALQDLISVENALLRSGRANHIVELQDRKADLTEKYREAVGRLMKHQKEQGGVEEEVRRALVADAYRLEQIMVENCALLRAAMTANQTRVNAIMRALAEQSSAAKGYSSTGRSEHVDDPAVFSHLFNTRI